MTLKELNYWMLLIVACMWMSSLNHKVADAKRHSNCPTTSKECVK